MSALLILAAVLQAPVPNESNFDHWKTYIRPSAQEVRYEEVEWRPTFWEAVNEAQRAGKPILLWAMNGHPMACT
jgi:hypothetical protein